MSDAKRTFARGGIELEDHRGFQEKFWVAERIGWIGFGLVIVLALLGLTGFGGPLSRAEIVTESVRIEYPRVTRWAASDDLTVDFLSGGASERRVTLSPEFADSFDLGDVHPEPLRSEATVAGETMVFGVPNGGPGKVRFRFHARSAGPARFDIRIDDGAPLSLSPLVLP